jgi:hypothetical protein
MKNLIKLLYGVAASVAVGGSAHAFSLAGPPASWMTADMNYDPAFGPMTPGEGYRYNSPVLVYGFDQSFVEFFGAEGVAAVESAIKILNDLPAASALDPANYPTSTARVNQSARRLRLFDLKTCVLSALVENMGLVAPERYVWTLRQVERPNEFTRNFLTLRRNYDPFTVLPSSFINGTLYTFQIQQTAPDVWEAVEISVDPAEPNVSVVGFLGGETDSGVGRIDPRAQRIYNSRGLFFSGLTQDDVGGLRYLYHPGTVAVEQLPAGTTLRTSSSVDQITSGGGGGQSAWTPVYGVGVATGGTGGATNTTGVVDIGVRRGVDKVTFVRGDVGNQVLGTFRRPVVVRYSDSVSTNGVGGTFRTQNVERTMAAPDILFTAEDLGTGGGVPVPVFLARTVAYQNLGPLNSNQGGAGSVGALGPGIKDSATTVIALARVGLTELNSSSEDNLTEEQGFTSYMWGSFDGSTNAPIVYPVGRVNLRMVESIVRNRN